MEEVEIFINEENVNVRGRYGKTALHYAAE